MKPWLRRLIVLILVFALFFGALADPIIRFIDDLSSSLTRLEAIYIYLGLSIGLFIISYVIIELLQWRKKKVRK